GKPAVWTGTYRRLPRSTRPDRALILLRDGPDALVHEAPYACSLERLRRLDVAFRIGRDAVRAEELPRVPSAVAEAVCLLSGPIPSDTSPAPATCSVWRQKSRQYPA